MSKPEDKKSQLVLPGAYKKKKPTAKLKETGSPYTSLSLADVRILLGKDKSKEVIIDLSDDYFQLENDEFLLECGEARCLDLSRNCLTKFVNGASLGKLKHLVLDQNQLDQVNFAGLKSLLGLSLSRNRMQALNDMSDLSKLQYLDLSYNRITRGWNQLAKLKALKVLDLGNCRIDLPAAEFNSVILVHLQSISKLQYINFSGNPVETHIPEFKYLIIHTFPELKYYNWDPVGKEDRAKAESIAKTQKWATNSTQVVALKKENAPKGATGTPSSRRQPEPRASGVKGKKSGGNSSQGAKGDEEDSGGELELDVGNDLQDIVKGLTADDVDDSSTFLTTLDEILDGEPIPTDMTFTISNINIDELLNTDIDSLKTPRSPRASTTRHAPTLPSVSGSSSGTTYTPPKTSRGASLAELDVAENELLDMLNQQLNAAPTKKPAPTFSAGNDDVQLEDIVQALISEDETEQLTNNKSLVSEKLTATTTTTASTESSNEPSWGANLDELVMEKMMGLGSYCETYLGKWTRQNDSVIIKKLKDNNPNMEPQESVARFKEETEQLIQLSHPNLVPILGACATTDAKYVIWKYVQGKSLHSYLRESSLINNVFILKVARVVASVTNYLHQQGVLHGALKSNNVLIDMKTKEVFVNDYGYMDIKDWIDMPEAHPQYMAPELINQEAYAEKIDIYSYGCLLYEMLTSREPFEDKDIETVIDLVKNAQHPTIPPATPDAFLRLLNGCWSRDPTQRPAFQDIENYLAQPDNVLLSPNLSFPLPLISTSSSYTPPTHAPSVTTPPAPSPSKPATPVFRDPNPATPPVSAQPNPRTQKFPDLDDPPKKRLPVTSGSSSSVATPQPRSHVVYEEPRHAPSTQPQVETGLPVIHRSYMSDEEYEKLQAILAKLTEMLTQNVPALQLKAIKALYAVINTPGRIYEIAKNQDIPLAIVNILRQTGQIGKFELVEQTIILLTDLAAHPIMSEILPNHRLLLVLAHVLTNFMDDHSLMQLVVKLVATLVINYPPNAEAALKSGVTLPLFNMLKTRSQGGTLQVAALTALSPLLENESIQEMFINTHGFALLMNMVNTKNSKLKLHVLETLVNFLPDTSLEEQLEPLKLKERMLRMAESTNPHLKEVGLNGVLKLVGHPTDTISDVDKLAILDTCLAVLNNSNEQQQDIVSQAIKALALLLEDETCVKAFLETESAFSSVLPHTSSLTDKVRVHALEIIGFALATPSGRKNFVSLGGFVNLVACLDHWSSKVRYNALVNLITLVKESPPETEEGSVVPLIIDTELIAQVTSVLAYIDAHEEQSVCSDLIFEISEKKIPDCMHEIRMNGTIGTLLKILSMHVPPANDTSTTDQGGNAVQNLVEAVAYAVASLSADATNRTVFLQDPSFVTSLDHLRNSNTRIAERAAWILGNIALDPAGREFICVEENVLSTVIKLLSSHNETVLSSLLRILLAIARQPDYHPYIKAPDPQLTKLKALKQHQSPKISQIATKLVEVLAKA